MSPEVVTGMTPQQPLPQLELVQDAARMRHHFQVLLPQYRIEDCSVVLARRNKEMTRELLQQMMGRRAPEALQIEMTALTSWLPIFWS